MALANLFVPVVLLSIRRFTHPVIRILCGLWLLIYAAAVPFSSSRGGWLGLVVALLVSGIYWAWKSQLIATIRRWSWHKVVIAVSGLLILVILAGFLGSSFLVEFASHPSHGNDPFGTSGREIFWANAIKIWQAFPIFGAGPGRFAFEYLRVSPNVPPGFWPVQAHDIFFEALAEFGIVGLAGLLFLIGAIIWWAWRMLARSTPRAQAWTAAVLAGECALLAQLIFDDLTAFMAVMVPSIFLLAWVGSNTESPLPTHRRVSLGWLTIPVFILIGGVGWGIWTYKPFNSWLGFAQNGQWTQAAEQASISASRDPDFHFYATEAGLLWAWQAHYENDPIGIIRARAYFEKALHLESSTSWNWANLAMLDEASGDMEAAISSMEKAVKLSPNMAAYVFNLGRFYEQSNLEEMAISSYQKALNLKPEWQDLAFWRETPARSQALGLWQTNPPAMDDPSDTFWYRAQIAIQAGKLDEAQQMLAQAHLMTEPEIEITRTEIRLAEARGDTAAAHQFTAKLRQLVEQDQMMLDVFVTFTYPAFLAGKDGTGIMAVPGLVPAMNYESDTLH